MSFNPGQTGNLSKKHKWPTSLLASDGAGQLSFLAVAMSEFFPNSWHIFLSVVDNPPVMV
jgi:hypothetical protein